MDKANQPVRRSRAAPTKSPSSVASQAKSLTNFDLNLAVQNGIFIVLNDKGGVGKTTTTKVLAEYLITKGIVFTGVETDRRNPNFLRAYQSLAPEFATAFFSEDPTLRYEGDIIATKASSNTTVVVDTPAQCGPYLLNWLIEDGVISFFDEQGIPVTAIWVSNSGYDSQALYYRFLENSQGRLRYFFVCNQGMSKSWDFVETDETFLAYKKSHNVTVFNLPFGPTRELALLDKHQIAFSSAIKNPQQLPGEDRLGVAGQQRLATFLRNAFQEIDNSYLFYAKP